MPASVIPGTGAEDGALRTLARRIARNREVIGLHYPSDARIANKLAAKMFPLLLRCPSIAGSAGVSTNATSASVVTDARPAVPIAETVTPTPIFDDDDESACRMEITRTSPLADLALSSRVPKLRPNEGQFGSR